MEHQRWRYTLQIHEITLTLSLSRRIRFFYPALMPTLPELTQESIEARRLFRHGQRILVAVSGGVDSMVLLHLLHDLSARNRWRLTAAHLNHQLRGRSSDADERLVRKTAAKLKIPLVIGRLDVRRFAGILIF